MIDPNNEQIQTIADCYGWEPQSRQCIEEMAELTKAINKLYRIEKYPWLSQDNREKTDGEFIEDVEEAKQFILDNIAEEIIDVEICLAQIKYLLEKKYDFKIDYDYRANGKIKRELYRIDKYSNNEKESMETAIINSLPAGTKERIEKKIFKDLMKKFCPD